MIADASLPPNQCTMSYRKQMELNSTLLWISTGMHGFLRSSGPGGKRNHAIHVQCIRGIRFKNLPSSQEPPCFRCSESGDVPDGWFWGLPPSAAVCYFGICINLQGGNEVMNPKVRENFAFLCSVQAAKSSTILIRFQIPRNTLVSPDFGSNNYVGGGSWV